MCSPADGCVKWQCQQDKARQVNQHSTNEQKTPERQAGQQAGKAAHGTLTYLVVERDAADGEHQADWLAAARGETAAEGTKISQSVSQSESQ